jgi:peptide/nickel transport system ATP-binding protein
MDSYQYRKDIADLGGRACPEPGAEPGADPVLEIRGLRVVYHGTRGPVVAVDGVDLSVARGETVAVVGESGSGKSTTALAVTRLLPAAARVEGGEIRFGGQDLARLDEAGLRALRGRAIGFVPQDPAVALNPLRRVGDQVAEVLRIHGIARGAQARERAVEALGLAGVSEPALRARQYPHQLSGGMRQRVLIAMSLLLEPEVLILDEPTTALDILTQRSIVDVLHEVRERLGFSMIFISHDLSLAAELADRVATMYAGRIVETGGVRDLFYQPRHPYTLALINAVPPIVGDLPDLESIPGGPPSLAALPRGCTFHPRCKFATQECKAADPPLLPVTDQAGSGHEVACIHSGEVHLERRVQDDDLGTAS